MIDGWNLAASALWILGLALGLAAVSVAYWQRSVEKGNPAGAPARWHVQAALDGAGVLFTVGWAASSTETWERLLWCLLAVLLAVQFWWDCRHPRV
jgi:hypothetical protein